MEYKCLCCNRNYEHTFDEKLKKHFFNTHKFFNRGHDKFILGVYPYEYMYDQENFNETSLPEKEDFHSHVNMEDITDADYAHAKRFCIDFEKEHLGKYHDLHVQSDTLLLIDVFENFRNMCLKYTKLILQNFFQLLDQHDKQL